jgi:hypothetical protein
MRRAYIQSRRIRYSLFGFFALGTIYIGISNDSGTNNPFKWKEYSIQKIKQQEKINNSYDLLINSMNIDTSFTKILKENTPFEDKKNIVKRLE